MQLRSDDRDDEHPSRVERCEAQSGDEGALIHVADRAAELVGHHDQHQARRDDLRQRARGRDHPGGDAPVIAVAQHDRQRDQAHRDHRCRHHAGGRGQQRAHEDDGIGEAAADRPEHLADGIEQILGHAAAFQDQAHEGEERDRQQRVVRHDAEDALRQCLDQLRTQQTVMDGDGTKQQAVGGERERDRIADHEQDDQHREHERRDVGDEQRGHCSPPGFITMSSAIAGISSSPWAWRGVGSGMRPMRKAARLMISDTPWIASRKKPAGIMSFTGQRNRPPALGEYSVSAKDCVKTGQDSTMMMIAMGRRKKIPPRRSIQARVRGVKPAADDVDTDVLVPEQGIASAEQKESAIEIPLQFKPTIRAVIEKVAHNGIAGTD